MDLKGDWLEDVHWIRLAEVRERWRTFVDAVMNLRVLAPQSYLETVMQFVNCTAVTKSHLCCRFIRRDAGS
jgi:hypothetical protein